MLIKNSVQHNGHECDSCDFASSFNLRLAIICQGATGRFCEVMWLCDEHSDGSEIDIDKARKIVENIPGAWAEF